jgi:hypothetical protein
MQKCVKRRKSRKEKELEMLGRSPDRRSRDSIFMSGWFPEHYTGSNS